AGNGASASASAPASVPASAQVSVSSSVLAPTAKRPPEAKKTSKETGGLGNGYRIPKASPGTRKPQIPPITTQAAFEDYSRQFTSKYQEMKSLKAKIDKKKELFHQLGSELDLAMGTEREADLKRKVQEAFDDDIVDRKVLRQNKEPRSGISSERAAAALAEQSKHLSVNDMMDRYKNLHYEVDTIKRALWDASNAQTERITSAGGGNG
ncbi:hypothetical protein BGZ65_004921, partial [Modicella reniformis]